MGDETYILALVGSQKGSSSNTRFLCQQFLKTVEGKWNQQDSCIHSEIITADHWNLKSCLSCGLCFREGRCPLDGQDGLGEIKQKMKQADGLIFASPVYAAAVSGDMKRMVDRLSGWLHTMPLIGKTGAALSTADSNNGETAVNYMGWALETMGATVPVSLNVFIHFGPVKLHDRDRLLPALEEKADLFIQGMEGRLSPTSSQEEYFARQGRSYGKKRKFGRMYPELRFAEERIWEEQGYFAFASMEEIIKRRIGREKDEGMV